ncbi:MAG: YfcC family protein [Clostridia bacterium]|nr:YfcC family protein [Clostridia bacterium]
MNNTETVELENERTEKKSRSFSNINKKSFIVVVAILTVIIAFCGALSYIIPQGSFLRDEENGAIIDGTYTQGEVDGIAIWRILTAPFRVFASSDALTIIFISLFLLIMSGVFNLLEKTDGIRIFIGKTVQKFAHKRKLVVCIAALVFMAFGSFFGMFEELVTLLPLVSVFMLSMGFDTLTGLGVCMLAACFGFSAAITNPFSVGLASSLAGTYVLDGAWLRILFFVFVYAAVCAFLLLHIRKITKNPEKSLTYALDIEKRKTLDFSLREENEKDKRIFKIYASFFGVQLVMLLLIASIRAIADYAIPLLSVSFLVGGIVAGLLVCENKKDVAKHMLQGAAAMLPAVLMIALASSVKLVMVESGIMDTVMYRVIEFLRGKNKFLCIILIYFLILFLQVFIGSASAKIMLVMPIVLPVATALGLSPTVLILTYCIADGFTDMILPTNPVLLIGLSMANVSYGKWVRWTWALQLFVFAVTVLLLMFAVQIGY